MHIVKISWSNTNSFGLIEIDLDRYFPCSQKDARQLFREIKYCGALDVAEQVLKYLTTKIMGIKTSYTALMQQHVCLSTRLATLKLQLESGRSESGLSLGILDIEDKKQEWKDKTRHRHMKILQAL